MRLERGDRVRYLGDATEEQVRWGSNDDPRLHCIKGEVYRLYKVEVHSWHTKYFIICRDGVERKFNSVSFEYVPEEGFKVGDVFEGHNGRYTVEGKLG